MRKRLLVIWSWCALQPALLAQNPSDSVRRHADLRPFFTPTVLMLGGLATQGHISRNVRGEVLRQFPAVKTRTDDVLQFAPTVLMLGLGAVGVEGRHGLRDQVILTVLSHGLAQAITQGLKYTVAYPRPDGSGQEAFPSGHTTMAFTGAALLTHEYGGRSGWYTVGGYGAATTVGVLRILENRHWLADVLFGAGVGIGATELVYQTYPWLKRVVFHRKNVALIPVYTGYSTGVTVIAVF